MDSSEKYKTNVSLNTFQTERLLEAANWIKTRDLANIKTGIWLYFFLLIFEGAFRKWFLPSLATPLLVIRDPVALWVVFAAWKKGYLVITNYLKGIFFIGISGFLFAIIFGHGNLWVAIYGSRILLIHFPMILAIGAIFDRNDIIKLANTLVWIAIPMTILICMQFYSPQSAWVNKGTGMDSDGAGFSGAGEYLRPPGTFSFTNGVTLFYTLVAPCIVYFWLNLKKINTIILIAATVCLLAAIPLSISRSLLFQVVITFIAAIGIISRNPKYFGRIFIATVGIIVLFIFLSGSPLFTTATGAFTERFDSANENEGGLVEGVLIDRFLGGLATALANSTNVSLFGMGIGMGTNVGAMLLSGSFTFLIAEGEWGRIIGELGPILGLILIIMRLKLAIVMAKQAFRRLAFGDILPWLLLSATFISLAQGQWSQPTSLGFCILSGGILMASLKGENHIPDIENQT